jgi:hypothetical protein
MLYRVKYVRENHKSDVPVYKKLQKHFYRYFVYFPFDV